MLRFSANTFFFAALAGTAIGAFTTKGQGQSAAPVTIELYSDYQCPSCKSLHDQVLPGLIDDYVKKGKVYLIYREFPLPMHQHAREAAALAAASYRVGKYEAVSNALFAKQAAWTANGKLEEVVASVLTAAEMKKVKDLSKQPAIVEEINYEVGLGRNADVNQTPTLVIKHKGKSYPIKGVNNYSVLRKFIDDLLKK